MKFVIAIAITICIGCNGCGGFFNGGGETPPQGTDTEVVGPADTEEPPGTDIVSECERACVGFDFAGCTSVLMKALPVGIGLSATNCVDRCNELIMIYSDLPDELDFECIEKAASCPAVAGCFGVEE